VEDKSMSKAPKHRHPMWLDFLNYLVHEECFNAEQLLNVIEKPWKWKSELTEYAEKGNCPSLQ